MRKLISTQDCCFYTHVLSPHVCVDSPTSVDEFYEGLYVHACVDSCVCMHMQEGFVFAGTGSTCEHRMQHTCEDQVR